MMIDKILLYDYCLSVYFAGSRKPEKYRMGTGLFFSIKYYYILLMLAMFVLSNINYVFPMWCLLIFIVVLGYISHFAVNKWIERRLNRMQVEKVYKKLSKKRTRAWISLLFIVFMYASFFVVGVLTVEGYSLR